MHFEACDLKSYHLLNIQMRQVRVYLLGMFSVLQESLIQYLY